jgi:hypothetical protein
VRARIRGGNDGIVIDVPELVFVIAADCKTSDRTATSAQAHLLLARISRTDTVEGEECFTERRLSVVSLRSFYWQD